MIEVDCQALIDELRRHRVKNTADCDSAVASDFDAQDLIVEIAMGW